MKCLIEIFTVVSLVFLSCFQEVLSDDRLCKDKLSSYMCGFLAKHKACKANPVRMAVYCPKTCGYCVPKQTCSTMTCPPSQICVNTEQGAKCRCLFECKTKMNTGKVCGQNGKTYDDLCDLINDGCSNGDYLMVKHYGECVKTTECKDSERESKEGLCKQWEKSNACFDHASLMREFCPKTCGFCRQQIEPKCKQSQYGCCWDSQGDVAAKGKYGQGCGECKDQRFCKYFRKACGGVENGNAATMKKLCPETCHYCRHVSSRSP